MKTRKKIFILGMMLILASGNCMRICSKSEIRSIEYISIFVFGAITALFAKELIFFFKNR